MKKGIILDRIDRFDIGKHIISQFQLDVENRKIKITKILSKDNKELEYQLTELSGYITIYDDIEIIIVVC